MIYAGTFESEDGKSGFVGVFSSIRSLMSDVRKDMDFREGDWLFVWEETLDMPAMAGVTPAAVYKLEGGEWLLTAQPVATEDEDE